MEPLSMDVITQLVASLGPSGALVWFLWFTTSKTIPELTAKHTATIESISARFTKSIEEERTARREEITSLKTWIREEAKCRYNTDNPEHLHQIRRNGEHA